MHYFKGVPLLKERALYQVAINLCQDISFKEAAMRLEKPTYGTLIHFGSYFTNDPNVLSTWSTMEASLAKRDCKMYCELLKSIGLDKNPIELWDAAMNEQCQRLTEGLPHSLKSEIHVWINRIALEYSSYCQRQELLFGVSRYYLMSILTIGDWMETARLDEKKLAKRMVKDKQLTVLQRYRIACVYCLHEDIPHLWNRLTIEEKYSISGNDKPSRSQEKNNLVLLWSYHMDGNRAEKVTGRKNYFWAYAALEAVRHGNQVALMSSWKRLHKFTQNQMVVHMASESLEKWKSIRWRARYKKNCDFEKHDQSKFVGCFNLPCYYSELILFLLSKMNEYQQLSFFEKVFNKEKADPYAEYSCNNILDCFLEWPLWDHFLPIINLLRGKISKHNFAECFLSLARRHVGDEVENHSSASLYNRKEKYYFDYGNLLLKLWKEMPRDYRDYYYREYLHRNYSRTVTERFLFMLLEDVSSFQEKDEAFFKKVWGHLSQEERIAMIQTEENRMCHILLPEKLSLVNWLLKESLPDVEINSFKTKLIKSAHLQPAGLFWALEHNYYNTVEDFLDWAYESDTEKTRFKYEMLKSGNRGLKSCTYFLSKGEITQVENIINFCLSSNEDKQQFKEEVTKSACLLLLKNDTWQLQDEILTWISDAETKNL